MKKHILKFCRLKAKLFQINLKLIKNSQNIALKTIKFFNIALIKTVKINHHFYVMIVDVNAIKNTKTVKKVIFNSPYKK
jgi:hypothetical protein